MTVRHSFPPKVGISDELALFESLVPKLCLGTQFLEALLRVTMEKQAILSDKPLMAPGGLPGALSKHAPRCFDSPGIEIIGIEERRIQQLFNIGLQPVKLLSRRHCFVMILITIDVTAKKF
ncbi:hypothetical protein CA54_13310 [Symmachiella macrocystis]|uniref:Uncharacterized protein n=1 Tax=Symmachiella macrocystis TaxID=2527985 RepID=A0A5C6BLG0_9PLAN|nr:hypothetical protein CA54_13310 [Symmachiella macrocystis]